MSLPAKVLGALGAMVLCGVSLNADWIGPSDCATCFGSVYTLSNLGMTASTATTETWEFAYIIDTSGFTGPAGAYIGSVAVKVTSKVLDSTLYSAPGDWTSFENQNVNNAGCRGGGSGWLSFSGGSLSSTPTLSGTPYTWDFSVVMPAGALLSTPSIKANYDPRNGWITSERIAVPEGGPAEWPLSVVAMGAWLWWQRRCRRRAS